MHIAIHTYLSGKVKEVCRATLEVVVVTFAGFAVELEAPGELENMHLIMLEGRILAQGLPGAARELMYRDVKSDVLYQPPEHRKEVRVVGRWGQTVPAYLGEEGEIVSIEGEQTTYAVAFTHFLLLPKSKEGGVRAIGYRYKHRTLERQYTMMQSFESEVRFITCNSW